MIGIRGNSCLVLIRIVSISREKQEKLTILMKNTEISQKEEILRKELRQEQEEAQELHDRASFLQRELDKKYFLEKCNDEAKFMVSIISD